MPRQYRRKAAPVRKRMYGRGAYTVGGDAKPKKKGVTARGVGRFLGRLAGEAVSPLLESYVPALAPIAPAISEQIGGKAGSLFKRLTGWGSYEIKDNSILYPDKVVPTFGEDSIRIKKREFIANIDAFTTFKNYSFSLNPGLDATFPWLSQIAANYEQYRFNGLVFQLVSTCSDSIASTTNLGLGTIACATDYDAADGPYSNMVQALSSMFSNTCKPSEDCMHAVECAPNEQAQKLYYVRSGAAAANTDIRLYDLGLFQVLVDKCPANYTGMMQLWVSYDVTFYKSQFNAEGSIDTDLYYMTNMSSAAPFGTARTLRPFSSAGLIVTNTDINFPNYINNGYYYVMWRANGTSAAIATPTITLTGCQQVTVWMNDSSNIVTSGASTGSNLIVAIVVRVVDPNAKIAFSSGTYPGGTVNGDLLIQQVNGEIFAGK